MRIKVVIIILFLYLFFHNPIYSFLGGLGAIKLLYPFMLMGILRHYSKQLRIWFFFRKEFILFFTLFALSLLRTAVGGDPVESYNHFIFFVEITFLPLFLLSLIVSYNEEKFIRTLLIVGAVGGVISSLCVFIPSFGQYVKYELMITGNQQFWEYRGFGMAESLTGFYGFTQASILSLGLFHLKNNKWFLPFTLLIFVSIIFNARTGALIAASGVLLYLINNPKASTILTSIIAVGIVYFGFTYVMERMDISEGTQKWITDFFMELDEARNQNSVMGSHTANELFGRMWILPDNLSDWIFGRGISIFGASSGSSDVGLIIHLNYCGLVYVFAVIALIIHLIKRMLKKRLPHSFLFLFIAVLVIASIKSNYVANSGTFRFMMLCYYYYIYKSITERNIQTIPKMVLEK